MKSTTCHPRKVGLPHKPVMKATPEEIANRPIPQRPLSGSLRLKQGLTMTLPPGQDAHVFKDTYRKDPEYGYCWGHHPLTTPEQQAALERLIISHHDTFAWSLADLPGYTGPGGDFTIQLTTDDYIFTRARRKSPMEIKVGNEKCSELAALGFLVPAPIPAKYASETTCPGKKSEAWEWTERRQCGDFRAINAFTVPDRTAMPLPDDLFAKACQCSFFSKLDLKSGFHQIKIKTEDQPKTAIWWGDRLWMHTRMHTRMPFGLKNAPAHFQRVVSAVLDSGGASGFCQVYIDDLVVYSNSMEEHLRHLDHVLTLLKNNNLRAHPGKSVFGSSGLEYLGHFISKDGLSPVEAKTMAFRKMRAPANKDEVKVALGLFGYYRGFVPGFSTIAQPLTKLLRQDVPWEWGVEQESAFQELIEALCTPGLVIRPVDPSRHLRVHTDWSGRGIGALLTQTQDDGREYVCAAASRSLNRHESSYSSFHGEMLACVWAVKLFHHHLHGVPFTVVTDHQPLTYLLTQQNLQGKHARWALMLSDYDITIEHRSGSKHQNADALSRLIASDLSSNDTTGARLDGDAVTPSDVTSALPTVLTLVSRLPSIQSRQSCPWELTHCRVQRPPPLHTGAYWQQLLVHPPETSTSSQLAVPHKWTQRQSSLDGHPSPVSAHVTLANPTPHAALPGRHDGIADSHGIHPTQGLNTATLPPSIFTTATTHGLTLFEPFGGMASGLEMLLRNGVCVRRYLYSDIDAIARAVATFRVKNLSSAYPELFPPSAWEDMFCLPQDVKAIKSLDLLQAGALDETQWIVVAGWECQDLSPAGSCQGLDGLHSSTFFDLLRLVGTLQQFQTRQPPIYLLENVALEHNHSSQHIREITYPFVCAALGVPLTFDACQVGSYAHRLRSYWTNLASISALQLHISGIERRPDQIVQEILDPNHRPQPVVRSDTPPFYVANVLCPRNPRPRAALPMLMAHPMSYAFRSGGAGTLIDTQSGQIVQPTANERERCMGYSTGATDAPGVTEAARCTILGRAMDSFALHTIYSVARLVACHSPASTVVSVAELGGEGERVTSQLQQPHYTFAQYIHAGAAAYLHDSALANHVEALEETLGSLSDIHADKSTLAYLRDKILPGNDKPLEQRRVLKRANFYSFHPDGHLYRLMPDGSSKKVPHPAERLQIITECHERCGHFGQKRTRSLLLSSFWWVGMSEGIKQVLKSCQACARSNATFNKPHPTLHPVPVVGLFYRWNVDLCGPLPTCDAGYRYVQVCIESLSNHVEAVPLKTKEATEVAAAFLTHVLGRFGSCAEVLSDQGGEFQGTFHALLTSCLIDHRLTSPNHPQANGLSERCVQTVKRALRKLTDDVGHVKTWEQLVPWLVLGYLCSAQSATGISPYQLLYATTPIIPPAIRERLLLPIDFDDAETTANSLITRAELVKRNMPIAMGNIKIAQHRDTLRYAMVKGGAFIPKLRRFQAGDYVCVRRRNVTDTLQFSSHPELLRVREVLPQGTLRLQGKCGKEITVHCGNCTPCHLLNLNPNLDPTLARPDIHHKCEICRSAGQDKEMLLCSNCNSGWHLGCFQPPLASIPSGVWFCPICQSSGRTSTANPPAALVPDLQPAVSSPLRPSGFKVSASPAIHMPKTLAQDKPTSTPIRRSTLGP